MLERWKINPFTLTKDVARKRKGRIIESYTRMHIDKSMEEVQNTCQKVELSEKIRVLLSELPLTCKERQRLFSYTEFLTLLNRSTST